MLTMRPGMILYHYGHPQGKTRTEEDRHENL